MLWTIFVILLILWLLGMVSGATLGGFGVEQLGVEVDGRLEVGHVERQLDARHGGSCDTLAIVDG